MMSTGKKAVLRGLLGFPLGVFLGYTITIVISLICGGGYYSPVVPALVKECGSEIGAVALQYLLSGILGAACAAGSVVWETESWSILKQTVVHFFILSLSMLPVAYFTYWMEHTAAGIAKYFGIFIAMYFFIWLAQYLSWRHRIQKINSRIGKE